MTDTKSHDNGAQAVDLATRCADHMWSNDVGSQHLGMAIQSVGEGCAEMTMTVQPHMLNGHSICHGGMIFTLADSAFAFACNSQNLAAVAASCSIEFLRPAYAHDTLLAKADVLNQGKRTGLYDVIVENQSGDVIAQFRGRSARINGPVLGRE